MSDAVCEANPDVVNWGDICCGVTGRGLLWGAGRGLLRDVGMGRRFAVWRVGEVCYGSRGKVCCEMQAWGVWSDVRCGQYLLL